MKRSLTMLLACAFCFSGCDKEEDPLRITSFEPTSGDYNTEVTIHGDQFDPAIQKNVVLFGSLEAKIISGTRTELVVEVPPGATTGNIKVQIGSKIATSPENFTVTAGSWQKKADCPKIADGSFDPYFSIGSTAYILASRRTVNSLPVDASFWAYSTISDTWSEKKVISKDFMGILSATWATDTKGYIVQYSKLNEYDPGTDTWTEKSGFAPDVYPMFAFYIPAAGKAYVITSSAQLTVYSHDNNTWTSPVALPFSNLDGYPMARATSTKGYVWNGEDVWEFNPVNGQWTKLPVFPGADESNFMFSIQDELYIGYSGYNNMWVYKPALNKWIQKASLTTVLRFWPIYFSISNKGYLGLGLKFPEQYFTKDLFEYTPQ